MSKSNKWAVLVIWFDGSTEYVKEGMMGGGSTAVFSKQEAEKTRDFLMQGFDADEVQSINIVPL